MTQPNLLELAKQGDARAIAALINRSVQPKGITVVKAAFKDSCLQIMLESATVPNQQALVAFVRKEITGLAAASIQRVRVYGRRTGEEVPAWSQEFELARQPLPLSNLRAAQSMTPREPQKQQPSLKELAMLGNVQAITTLLNRAIQHKSMTATARLKDGCLQVMLESNQVPDEEFSITTIRKELTSLKVESIKTVKVYGRQTGEDFPAWSQEFEKDSNRSYTNNYAHKIFNSVNMSAKSIVVNADKKFWQIPSLLRFGIVGIVLLVVIFNVLPILKSADFAMLDKKVFSSYNPDEEYKYLLEDFIKIQLKKDEALVESMKLFKAQGGFEVSKERAMKNCKALGEGVLKEKLLQNKGNEVISALNFYKNSRTGTEKQVQQMGYLFAIYTAEVFAGQYVYCPETRKKVNTGK